MPWSNPIHHPVPTSNPIVAALCKFPVGLTGPGVVDADESPTTLRTPALFPEATCVSGIAKFVFTPRLLYSDEYACCAGSPGEAAAAAMMLESLPGVRNSS